MKGREDLRAGFGEVSRSVQRDGLWRPLQVGEGKLGPSTALGRGWKDRLIRFHERSQSLTGPKILHISRNGPWGSPLASHMEWGNGEIEDHGGLNRLNYTLWCKDRKAPNVWNSFHRKQNIYFGDIKGLKCKCMSEAHSHWSVISQEINKPEKYQLLRGGGRKQESHFMREAGWNVWRQAKKRDSGD